MKGRLLNSIILPGMLALSVAGVTLSLGSTPQIVETSQLDPKDALSTRLATVRPGRTPTRFPYINVTRRQYDEALAKWRAQGITEYEIVVDYYVFNRQLMGDWTLHVQTDGEKAHVISASRGGEKDPEIKADFLTVEDMFRVVEDKLDYVPDPYQHSDVTPDSALYWSVSFHPSLGYPSISW